MRGVGEGEGDEIGSVHKIRKNIVSQDLNQKINIQNATKKN